MLRLSAVHKSFGGIQALRGVSFELESGEVHALVGENGAGKSTLIRIVTGAETPDAGSVEFFGNAVAEHDPIKARQLGIAAIYQQPALFPDLTVAENIAIGLEPPSCLQLIRWRKRRRMAGELLDRVGVKIDPDRDVAGLSMPEQQLVEIAKAIGSNARILIMDEPTASLSEREVDRLFAAITELCSTGVGIIYVSHRLDELFRIAGRVTVLRDGMNVATRAIRDTSKAELIGMMVGRELASVFPKRVVPIGAVLLEARGLSRCDAGVANVDLTVRSGEIVGLAGLVGAGRTEVGRVLFGLTPPDSGSIFVDGVRANILSPTDAVACGIVYVPEDRRRHGVILDMPIAANISLAVLRSVANGVWLDSQAETRLADRFIRELGIKAESAAMPAGNLSGGNQQKVALARWLAANPKIMILDEPTQGIDVGAKAEIHRLIGELAERGVGILLISSELPEILGISDRIVVMHGGRVTGTLERAEATPNRVLELALGHAEGVSA